MGFVDDVQVWLRTGRQRPEFTALPDGFDLAARRATLWTALGQAPSAHHRWADPDRIDRFVRASVHLLRQGIGASWSIERLAAVVDSAILHAVVPPVVSTVRNVARRGGADQLLDREVARVAGAALEMAFGGRTNVAAWCVAVGATAVDGSPGAIGRVLLRLVGSAVASPPR